MRLAERILSEGASGLPDAELLRVVLGARDELLACRLLSRGLPSLRRAGPGELLLESGVSAALAARGMAAPELGRRGARPPPPGRPRVFRGPGVGAARWGPPAPPSPEGVWAG